MEAYRYYSASAGDLSTLTIAMLNTRLKAFYKIHQARIKFEADIVGAKLK